MKKKICLLLMIFSVLFSGFAEEAVPAKDAESPYDDLATFMKVVQLVRERYVDENKTGYRDLLRGAMRGMLNSLDPHSNYESPKEFGMTVDDSKGSFAGIGANVRLNDDGELEVVRVIRNSPARKAGLEDGDVIVSADGQSLLDKSVDECVNLLRGEPGSKVILRVRRGDSPEKDYLVTRAEIETPSVCSTGILYGDTGYVRITQFTETTAADLDKFLEKYGNRLDGLIIDLRFNPGGLLDSAVASLSRFLETGKLIVTVEGRSEETVRHVALPAKKYLNFPIVILVNEFSASASEIFSGCMKDYRRGVLVGVKTFGKGSVQSVIPLPDGGGVRLTIAKYYTPSRRVIHGKGIEPDIPAPANREQMRKIAEFMANHEDSAPVLSGKEKPDDPQLEKAVEILKGIQIFRASGNR